MSVDGDEAKCTLHVSLCEVATPSSLGYQPSGIINCAVSEGIRLLVDSIIDAALSCGGAERCIIMRQEPSFLGTTPTPEHWRFGRGGEL